MKNSLFLFWQPKLDYLRFLSHRQSGRVVIVFFNYSIWILLFYISFLFIRFDTNIFWQLFTATLIGEIIEHYGKSHALWRRPLFTRHDSTPVGLIDRWYRTGSFPSGHTIKAVFFLLFLIQYPVFPFSSYLLLVTPLICFRVLLGFHYPIDILGGAVIGTLIWLSTKWLVAPIFLTDIIRSVFNFIFFIN